MLKGQLFIFIASDINNILHKISFCWCLNKRSVMASFPCDNRKIVVVERELLMRLISVL